MLGAVQNWPRDSVKPHIPFSTSAATKSLSTKPIKISTGDPARPRYEILFIVSQGIL